MDSYLPVLDYGSGSEEEEEDDAEEGTASFPASSDSDDDDPLAAVTSSTERGQTMPPSEGSEGRVASVPVKPQSQTTADNRRRVGILKNPGAGPSTDSQQTAPQGTEQQSKLRPQAKLSASRKAALEAVVALMDGELRSQAEVHALAATLSGSDLEQLAEERSLAGKCGNPLCLNLSTHKPEKERKRIDLGRRRVYTEYEPAHNFCSQECAAGHAVLALQSFHIQTEGMGWPSSNARDSKKPDPMPLATEGRSVRSSEIMALTIVEKQPAKVAADSARGVIACLAKEASTCAAADAPKPAAGAVEGYEPKAWRDRKLVRKCSHNRRVSFTDEVPVTKAVQPAVVTEAELTKLTAKEELAALGLWADDTVVEDEQGGQGQEPQSPTPADEDPMQDKKQQPVETETPLPADVPSVWKSEPEVAAQQPVTRRFKPPSTRRRVQPVSAVEVEQKAQERSSSQSQVRINEAQRRHVLMFKEALPGRRPPLPLTGRPLSASEGPRDAYVDDLDIENGLFSPVTDLPELSPFGLMHSSLTGWITYATQRYLIGESIPEDTDCMSTYGAKESLALNLSKQLPYVLQGLGHPKVSRGSVESELDSVVATFYIKSPLPHLKVKDWRLLAALSLRALSHNRLPAVQDSFCKGNLSALQLFLHQLGSGPEEFDLLHELLFPF